MRFDVIDYKKKGTWILRLGRGAWLVKQYPLLAGLFDSVEKVIAKIIVRNINSLHEKNIGGIISLLAQVPKGVGVFH